MDDSIRERATKLMEDAIGQANHSYSALMRTLFTGVVLLGVYFLSPQPMQPLLSTILYSASYILIPLFLLEAIVCMVISFWLKRKAYRLLEAKPSIEI